MIDVTRPGERCLVEGAPIIWWRDDSSTTGSFNLFPIDRSWTAEFLFEAGQDTLTVAELSDIEGNKAFIIEDDEREYSIRIHLIPEEVSEPAVLAGWMIEKGCIQQADALLASLPDSAELENEGI